MPPRASLLVLTMFAACVHSPEPRALPVPAAPEANQCGELLAPMPALTGSTLPPGYPFRRGPAPEDPWAAGRGLCERLGPQCTAVAFGADGLVDRVEFVFKPAPGRSPAWAAERMLELVLALKVELGLTEVPTAWPARRDGRFRFEVSRQDGVGVIDGLLETRKEFGADWRGTLWRRALTGVELAEARVLTRDAVQRRLLGRHYCRQEGTGEFELQRHCNPCDPSAGFADSCASACQDDKVEKTQLVTRQVVETRPLRMHLQRVLTAGGDERLCWAVSVPETPENHPPDVLVDAFSGEVLAQGLQFDPRGTSRVELDE